RRTPAKAPARAGARAAARVAARVAVAAWSRVPFLADAGVPPAAEAGRGALSAVRADGRGAGSDLALWRPRGPKHPQVGARSVVGRRPCPRDSSLRSSPRGHGERK